LPRAHGDPPTGGRLRALPEDFVVEELPAFAPDGEGEHVLLHVRKTGANTEWVARRLASHAGLPVSAVGYAGLKDRNAVASQWFSVHLGLRREADWEALQVPEIRLLGAYRHRRKLRRGALRGNRFLVRIRDLTGPHDLLMERLALIHERGVPNYFGGQRFGNDDGNLRGAQALFCGQAKRGGRHLRGLWLSAARSQLFNEVLAVRVERRAWDRPMMGDRMQLAGSRSHFLVEATDAALDERLRRFDIHPTGPLWGRGEMLTNGEAAELERGLAERFPGWVAGLAAAGMRQERRPLRLRPTALDVRRERDQLAVAFELPAGAYATAVLRELVDWGEADSPQR
jgi:tRNA pseudouridine13 synthase